MTTLDSYRVFVERIQTKDPKGLENGAVFPLVNIAIPETIPVELIYLTTCEPGAIKGPHVHAPPKTDRFVCVSGSCLIVCRNEETGDFTLWNVDEFNPCLIVIPPGNSHGIVCGEEGATVLSICNERYYPGHYNQEEVEWDEDQWKLINDYLKGE